MSVHHDPARPKPWRVRWRENGKQKSRSFAREKAARKFDAAAQERAAFGPHLMRQLDRVGMTLGAFLADGFEAHAKTLSPKSRMQYRWAIDGHLTELLDVALVDLTVHRLADHQAYLIDNGRTASTVRQAMVLLSGILSAAVGRDLIAFNPMRGVRRPPADVKEDVRPLDPVELERLIDGMTGRARAIVVLCGHLGLRPQEARRVLWSDFRESTLTISRARTKSTAARTRVIDVPATTVRELRAWQLQSGGRGDDPIVGHMTVNAMRAWAHRNLHGLTLYTLRHTHASLLHYCGWTVPDAAERMGHSPVVHMGIYAHPIKLIGSRRWRDLDDLIVEARAGLFPVSSTTAVEGG